MACIADPDGPYGFSFALSRTAPGGVFAAASTSRGSVASAAPAAIACANVRRDTPMFCMGKTIRQRRSRLDAATLADGPSAAPVLRNSVRFSAFVARQQED